MTVADFVERSRHEIHVAGSSLFDKGLLSASRTFVAAVRVPADQTFVIGQFSSRPKQGPPNIVSASLDGAVNSGELSPLVFELARVQAALFRQLPNVQSIMYTESPNITAFAVAHRPLPIVYGSGLIRRTQDDIPLVPWTPRVSPELVLEVLARNPKVPALLLANRGVLAWNESNVVKLADWVAGLEEAASVVVNAALLGGAKSLPPGAHEAMRKSRAGV